MDPTLSKSGLTIHTKIDYAKVLTFAPHPRDSTFLLGLKTVRIFTTGIGLIARFDGGKFTIFRISYDGIIRAFAFVGVASYFVTGGSNTRTWRAQTLRPRSKAKSPLVFLWCFWWTDAFPPNRIKHLAALASDSFGGTILQEPHFCEILAFTGNTSNILVPTNGKLSARGRVVIASLFHWRWSWSSIRVNRWSWSWFRSRCWSWFRSGRRCRCRSWLGGGHRSR